MLLLNIIVIFEDFRLQKLKQSTELIGFEKYGY